MPLSETLMDEYLKDLGAFRRNFQTEADKKLLYVKPAVTSDPGFDGRAQSQQEAA